ncbi:MAG: peptidase domain-containing ABC transporter [Prevotella sp.]
MRKEYKIKQLDITDCGAACLASICMYNGLKISIGRIRQYAYTDKTGTTVKGMIEACTRLGLSGKGVMAETEALDIVSKPVIAHVIVRKVLTHFVVIYKTTKDKVTIMDPADGEYHTMNKEEFRKIWTGVLILVEKSNDFVPGNQTVGKWSRLFTVIKPHKKLMIQALFGAVITTVLGLSTSIYIGKITDYVLVYGNKNLLNLMGVIMIAILFVQAFISIIRDKVLLYTGQKIDTDLILGYYQHLLHLPQNFFDSMRVGEIVSRITDAAKIRVFINQTALSLILNVLTIIVALAVMVFYSWKLTLFVLAATPLFYLSYYIYNKVNKKFQRKTMESAADLQSQLVESLNSIKTVKRFGLEDHSNAKTEMRYVRMLKNIFKVSSTAIYINNGNSLVSSGVTVAVLWFGSMLVIDNALTPGTLLMFYSLINYVISPVASLVSSNSEIQDAMIAADRLFQIMNLEKEETTDAKIELTENIAGDITFKNVRFRYGAKRDLFNDFNLTIKKGTTTAIVGRSGSGKTTLSSLLLNIYPVNEGSITIGDNNIELYSNESLRKYISIVPQSVELFAGTFMENIAVGYFHPNVGKIQSIIKLLGLEELINTQSEGLNTYISEQGTSLSGGERQRIAIARSLYKDPKILVLDEATSSLDSISERYVKAALDSERSKGTTIIIIAHRLSTIKAADTIVVLENGKVAESGSHTELLSNEKEYYNLWKEQYDQY